MAQMRAAVYFHRALIKIVAVSSVFAQHKSTAALALVAAVNVNTVVFTAMCVVSTFVNVFTMSSIWRQTVTMVTHAAMASIREMNTIVLAAISSSRTLHTFTVVMVVMVVLV